MYFQNRVNPSSIVSVASKRSDVNQKNWLTSGFDCDNSAVQCKKFFFWLYIVNYVQIFEINAYLIEKEFK